MSVPALNRRIFFKSSLVGASVALGVSKANANNLSQGGVYFPFAGDSSEVAGLGQQNNIFSKEEKEERWKILKGKVLEGEIYFPSAQEVFQLTGSTTQARMASETSSLMDRKVLAANTEISVEQSNLTDKFRNESREILKFSENFGSDSPMTNRFDSYELMDSAGLHHPYNHTGVVSVHKPYVQAIRPRASKGRVFMFDAVLQKTYWTIWRWNHHQWVYLNWFTDGWGHKNLSSVTKVERYRNDIHPLH